MGTRQPPPEVQGPLAEALVTLAGTPDDAPDIDQQLDTLVRLAAERVGAVHIASVTALRDGGYTTVAVSSGIGLVVDRAQYADQDGPCLEALAKDRPVTVPYIATTSGWPGFRRAATRMGLHSSVSLPLFSGSGRTIAVLNLYGRDAAAMAPLVAGVWALYDPERPLPADDDSLQPLDPGGDDLLAGFAEALTVHATIQLALGAIMAGTGGTAADAYRLLCTHAADAGTSLPAAAGTVITQGL
jgi:hypothetical protein